MTTRRHPNGYRILYGSTLLTIEGATFDGRAGCLYYRTRSHKGEVQALLGVRHLHDFGFSQDDLADVLRREEERKRIVREDFPECISPTGWITIPKDVQALLPNVENAERSRVEVWRFLDDKPRTYFAYVKEPKLGQRFALITTWTGDVIGHTTHYGASYRCGFGYPYSTRRSLVVKGYNGLTYWGTYFESSGDYCRLTAHKNQ